MNKRNKLNLSEEYQKYKKNEKILAITTLVFLILTVVIFKNKLIHGTLFMIGFSAFCTLFLSMDGRTLLDLKSKAITKEYIQKLYEMKKEFSSVIILSFGLILIVNLLSLSLMTPMNIAKIELGTDNIYSNKSKVDELNPNKTYIDIPLSLISRTTKCGIYTKKNDVLDLCSISINGKDALFHNESSFNVKLVKDNSDFIRTNKKTSFKLKNLQLLLFLFLNSLGVVFLFVMAYTDELKVK